MDTPEHLPTIEEKAIYRSDDQTEQKVVSLRREEESWPNCIATHGF